MDKGYILSNKYRRVVFDELSSGEGNPRQIAKKNHLIQNVVERTITDFLNGDIILEKHGRYMLTEKGKRLKQLM